MRNEIDAVDDFEYLPDYLRSYEPESELGAKLSEAADMIEHHVRRGDEWFELYFRVLADEQRMYRVAVELADVLWRYAVRLDIGHEAGVVDALANFAVVDTERAESRRKWDRTAGGSGSHPSNWE